MQNNHKLRASALFCFVLAEHVSAHPQPVRAIDSVRLVGAVDVQSSEDPYVTGKRLLAADDAVGALAAFQRTLAASPNSADALNAIGVSYDRLGRADLARSYYEAGLAIDPTSPRLLNNLGYSLFLRGDSAAAIAPLRAAAASDDAEAAAAAQATLMLIVEPPVQSAAAVVLAAPAARIELTNDGEQRLVFGPSGRSKTPAMSDETALVAVAAAWTDRDDAALVDQVRGEERAEQLALADAAAAAEAAADREREPVATMPAPAERQAAIVVPQPQPTVVRASLTTVRSSTALVVGETRTDAALARRRGALENKREVALTGGDPSQRIAAVFDSDDAELNAFAARVSARTAGNPGGVASGREQITARFRA